MELPYICPVCGKPMQRTDAGVACAARHSYDRAREGYINFMAGAGHAGGDNPEMSAARHAFLQKGYYAPLSQRLAQCAAQLLPENGRVLDICCGDGYYTKQVQQARPDAAVYGFDLSKAMVRLAAKSDKSTAYFVANLAHIPVADESFDLALHLFAPFNEPEFLRILKPQGRLLAVIPGRDHLLGLKKAVYDVPRVNDERFFPLHGFAVESTERIHTTIRVNGQEDIHALFQMTPYCYKTSVRDEEKLAALDSLETEISFILLTLKKL